MKYTLKMLKDILDHTPNKRFHMQGGRSDENMTITCTHPKFDIKLYVAEKGHGRTNPKLTGNPNAALKMTINVAKNVKDNLTEHYNNVELTPCL